MKATVLAFLFFACAGSGDGAGSAGPSGTEPGSGAPLVTDSDSAKAGIGKTVRVTGTALNAKLGPVVSTGGLVIYCFGKQEWSDDEVGQVVAVTPSSWRARSQSLSPSKT